MSNQRKINYNALVKRDRVHSSLYTDATVFADEMEKIFHRGWVYVGHASEVPNRGDFRLKRIGAKPVIMVRDHNGRVNLLLNRCRHRGATVCQDERGTARAFQCSYHGWTYRLTGELSGVPYPDGYDESFRREDYGLAKVPRIGEYRGLIFASLSPDGISLDEHLGHARDQIDLFADLSPEGEIEVSGGTHKYDFPANWKLQIENSVDGYHPPFVHETILAARERRLGRKLDTYGAESRVLTRNLAGGHTMLDFRQCEAGRNLNITVTYNDAYIAALERRYGKARTAEIVQAGGTHLLVFPNLVIIGVQIRVIMPMHANRTLVNVYPTLLKGVSDEINLARLRGHEAFFGSAGGGSPDDTEIFERAQAGFAATAEPWVWFRRAMFERPESGTVVGQLMDELPQRAIWEQWKRMMTRKLPSSMNRALESGIEAAGGR
jgi:phenylpropionate dioxygenase-like ring-hydroxylating dioxygenase large terminal subunit